MNNKFDILFLFLTKKMLLRSGYYYGYPMKVYINFDESSYEWRKNKISVGHGSFVYKL